MISPTEKSALFGGESSKSERHSPTSMQAISTKHSKRLRVSATQRLRQNPARHGVRRGTEYGAAPSEVRRQVVPSAAWRRAAPSAAWRQAMPSEMRRRAMPNAVWRRAIPNAVRCRVRCAKWTIRRNSAYLLFQPGRSDTVTTAQRPPPTVTGGATPAPETVTLASARNPRYDRSHRKHRGVASQP